MSNFVNLLDIVYPVGSMYFSTSSVSPVNTVGGTWEQIKDAVLAASGNSYSGAVNGYHGNKAMSINQMPTHSHVPTNFDGSISGRELWEYVFHVKNFGSTGTFEQNGRYTRASDSGKDVMRFCSNKEAKAGGGQNYIPYHYSINVWKRTA